MPSKNPSEPFKSNRAMSRPRKQAHERFAQHVASGLSLAESYRRTTGQSANADVKGAQWHGHPGVKQRIAELKARNAQRAQMTREELMAFYADVIRTPADQVLAGSPVIQAYEETSEGGRKVRICDKVQAGAQLCRMTGWNEPERVRLSVEDSLSAYLLELRAQPIGAGPILPLEGRALQIGNGENGEERRSANE